MVGDAPAVFMLQRKNDNIKKTEGKEKAAKCGKKNKDRALIISTEIGRKRGT